MAIIRVQNFIDDNKSVYIDNDLLKDGAIDKLTIDFDGDGAPDATDYFAQIGKEATALDNPGGAAGEKYKAADFGKYYQTDWQEGWSIGDKGKLVRLGWIFDKANNPILREAAILEGRYVAPEELSELSQTQLTSFCRDNILPDFKDELAALGNKLADFKRGEIGEDQVGKFKEALTAKKAYALKDALNQLYDLDAFFAAEGEAGVAMQETFDLAVLHFDYLNEGLALIEDHTVTAKLAEAMKVDAWSKSIMNDAGDAIDADKITIDTVAKIMEQENLPNVALALVNQAYETKTVYPLEDWSNADAVADYFEELIVLLARVGINIPNVTNNTNITGVDQRNGRVLIDQTGKPIKIDINGDAEGGVEKARLKPNTDGLRAIEQYLLKLLQEAGYEIYGVAAAAEAPVSTGPAPVQAIVPVTVTADESKNTWLIVDITDKGLTDIDGNAITIVHGKVIKDSDSGEVTSVDLYKEDRTAGIKLEGDEDTVTAHTFESTQAFVDWAGGDKKAVETEVITHTINSLFSDLQVTFKTSKTDLVNKAGIDRLAKFIIAHKDELNPIDILVTGYASVDSSSLNQGLANGRAVAIVEYLSQVLRDADVGLDLVALTAFNHTEKATSNTVGGGTYYIAQFEDRPGAMVEAKPREVTAPTVATTDPVAGTAPVAVPGTVTLTSTATTIDNGDKMRTMRIPFTGDATNVSVHYNHASLKATDLLQSVDGNELVISFKWGNVPGFHPLYVKDAEGEKAYDVTVTP